MGFSAEDNVAEPSCASGHRSSMGSTTAGHKAFNVSDVAALFARRVWAPKTRKNRRRRGAL
eukprot:10462837-Alexandrium_andersonii.AAC.1